MNNVLQITKKWELALQKEIPQELHDVSCDVGFYSASPFIQYK